MKENTFNDFVFSLDNCAFNQLKEAVEMRETKEKYGAVSFEELAVNCGRPIVCPNCNQTNYANNGYTPDGKHRYLCKNCGEQFTYLKNSIFYSTKKSISVWCLYVALMTFNVPLEMTEELCEISHPTAMLWRKKIFATVNGYQEKVWLKDRIWIDETYIYDSSLLHDDEYKKKRGLSNDQICIVVAIDIHKNVYAVICGHGKPSSDRIYEALKDHIQEGSVIVHDGEKAHNKLIEENNCYSEVYIADEKSKEYLENMALINNLCSWIKRYIYRFIGMRKDNLQSYLNWFVYLFRVKAANETWPKIPRILRHLILTEVQFKRKVPQKQDE